MSWPFGWRSVPITDGSSGWYGATAAAGRDRRADRRAGVWLAGRLARGLLEGIYPPIPLAFGGAAAGLALVAALACYLPARRVLRIEPARMLRNDGG